MTQTSDIPSTPTTPTTPSTPTSPPNPTTPTKPGTPVVVTMLITANIIVLLLLGIATYITYTAGPASIAFALIFSPIFSFLLPVLAALNLIFFTRYLLKRQVKGYSRLLSILFIILTIGHLISLGKAMYDDRVRRTPLTKEAAVALINDCQIRRISRGSSEKSNTSLAFKDLSKLGRIALDSDFEALSDAAAAASEKCGEINVSDRQENYHPAYITVDEAKDLLNACKVVGFYYTAGNLPSSDSVTQGLSTGIVLVHKEKPIRIHIEDSMMKTMVPIARVAQKQCPNLQFWHDGRYEQKDDNGNWQ